MLQTRPEVERIFPRYHTKLHILWIVGRKPTYTRPPFKTCDIQWRNVNIYRPLCPCTMVPVYIYIAMRPHFSQIPRSVRHENVRQSDNAELSVVYLLYINYIILCSLYYIAVVHFYFRRFCKRHFSILYKFSRQL